MTELEIALTRAYLLASNQDPVTALIRSVKDLTRLRRRTADAETTIVDDRRDAPQACLHPASATPQPGYRAAFG